MAIPDLHFDQHDPKYCSLIPHLVRHEKFDSVTQKGDAVHFNQYGTYLKDPLMRRTGRDDLELYREWMISVAREMRPGTEWNQLPGNHEFRMIKYLWGRAPDMAEMMLAMPDMLGFDKLNKTHKVKFIWHPFDKWDSHTIGDALITHGVIYGQNTPRKMIQKYGRKVLQGHNHQLDFMQINDIWCATGGHGSIDRKTWHMPMPSGHRQGYTKLREINGVTDCQLFEVINGKSKIFGGHNI